MNMANWLFKNNIYNYMYAQNTNHVITIIICKNTDNKLLIYRGKHVYTKHIFREGFKDTTFITYILCLADQ